MIRTKYNGVGLDQATAVMQKVESLGVASTFMITFEVSRYENGRERGFFVKCPATGKAVAFAEDRNSDDIAIYTGEAVDFTGGEKLITEEIYAKALYVGYQQYDAAASRIFNWLLHGDTTK